MSKKEFFVNFGMDEDIVDKVKKYINSIKKSGYFKGKNNQKIYYEKYIIENEKGRIVILHGFTECIVKYLELIYYFTKEKYSVFIMEHRGHGRSGCLSVFDKTQVTVEDFNFYVEDIKKFIDKIVSKNNNKNMYLFAHSMGGAIGTMFLEKYPRYFDKAILSSPMFNIAIGHIPIFLAKIMAKIAIIFGNGEKFIFGNMPYESTYDFTIASTSNESRYSFYYREILSHSELQRGGGSFKWFYESLRGISYILKKKNIKNIKIPVLILESGKDELVGNNISKKFLKRCKHCKVIIFKEAKHELYLENNDILEEYIESIFKFLEN